MRVDHGQRVTRLLVRRTTIRRGRARLERYAVNDVQRLRGGRERVGTTDDDTHTATRSTITLLDVDAGHLSLHAMGEVNGAAFHQVVTFQLCHSAGEVTLLHRTITDDDDFIHRLGIGMHNDLNLRTSPYIDGLRLIAYIRDYDFCFPGREADGEVTIEVCHRSRSCSGYLYCCSNDGLIAGITIDDGTLEGRLRRDSECREQQQE